MAVFNDVTSCVLDQSCDDHPRHGSGGGGYKQRTCGTRDWTATIEQLGGGVAAMVRGTKGDFILIESAGEGGGVVPEEGVGGTFSAPAVCLSVSNNYDLDTGEWVGRTYVIAADGAVTSDFIGGAGGAFTSKNASFDWTVKAGA